MQSSNSYIPGNASMDEILLAIENDPNATTRERMFSGLMASRALVYCNRTEADELKEQVIILENDLAVMRIEKAELRVVIEQLKEANEQLKAVQAASGG
jgi:hypothetical protein